ncbi:hypothetical protein V8C86DRAFT_1376225 [Haematococcus lacustris]
MPALPTLKQRLQMPLAAMWAPMDPDMHNQPALPLYDMAGAQTALRAPEKTLVDLPPGNAAPVTTHYALHEAVLTEAERQLTGIITARSPPTSEPFVGARAKKNATRVDHAEGPLGLRPWIKSVPRPTQSTRWDADLVHVEELESKHGPPSARDVALLFRPNTHPSMVPSFATPSPPPHTSQKGSMQQPATHSATESPSAAQQSGPQRPRQGEAAAGGPAGRRCPEDTLAVPPQGQLAQQVTRPNMMAQLQGVIQQVTAASAAALANSLAAAKVSAAAAAPRHHHPQASMPAQVLLAASRAHAAHTAALRNSSTTTLGAATPSSPRKQQQQQQQQRLDTSTGTAWGKAGPQMQLRAGAASREQLAQHLTRPSAAPAQDKAAARPVALHDRVARGVEGCAAGRLHELGSLVYAPAVPQPTLTAAAAVAAAATSPATVPPDSPYPPDAGPPPPQPPQPLQPPQPILPPSPLSRAGTHGDLPLGPPLSSYLPMAVGQMGLELRHAGAEVEHLHSHQLPGPVPHGTRLNVVRPGSAVPISSASSTKFAAHVKGAVSWSAPRPAAEGEGDARVNRADRAREAALREFENPTVSIWPAVPGSKLREGLYSPYTLPSGDAVFVYRARKTRVDELKPPKVPLEDDFLLGSGPDLDDADELARGLLKRCLELPIRPEGPALHPPDPPLPGTRTLPPRDSLYCIPAQAFAKKARELSAAAADAGVAGKPWALEDSIWAPRPSENDSKGYYDAKGIVCNAFDHDWGRCESKERFQRKMQKLTKGRPELLEGLKQELRSRYQGLLRIFDYYASLSSGDPFSLHLNAWGLLMTECQVPDEQSTHVKMCDLDQLFVATNFEEDRRLVQGQLNLDHALMRFEFLEAIIHVAIAKFIESRPLKKGKKKKTSYPATPPSPVRPPSPDKPSDSPTRGSPTTRPLPTTPSPTRSPTGSHSPSPAPDPGTQAPRPGSLSPEARGGLRVGVTAAAAAAAAAAAGGPSQSDADRLAAQAGPAGLAPSPGTGTGRKDVKEACIRLLEEHLLPLASPEALLDANAWRRSRLYTEDVDLLLQANKGWLQAVYEHYRGLLLGMKEGSLLLDMREWLQLLTDTGLFHKHFGTREAKLAFVWARLRHIRESNDLRAYQRVRSLTFREFLEALGRVADMMSLPPEAELRLAGCDGEKPTAQYYTSVRAWGSAAGAT